MEKISDFGGEVVGKEVEEGLQLPQKAVEGGARRKRAAFKGEGRV